MAGLVIWAGLGGRGGGVWPTVGASLGTGSGRPAVAGEAVLTRLTTVAWEI